MGSYQKLAALVLGLALLTGAVFTLLDRLDRVVPQQVLVSELAPDAEALYFYRDHYYYKNKEIIDRYIALVREKTATRISVGDAKDMNGEQILGFAYNTDKGRDAFIDDQGRLFLVVDKPEIRNKGRMQWLWWKLDADPYNYLYYYTEPDPELARLARSIRTELEQARAQAQAVKGSH